LGREHQPQIEIDDNIDNNDENASEHSSKSSVLYRFLTEKNTGDIEKLAVGDEAFHRKKQQLQ